MSRTITVYCSSSSKVDGVYFDAARALGRALATKRWTLVYGGNALGCMGALAGAARDCGGKVIGVTPRHFVDEGAADNDCDELIVTDTMRERKRIMEERADGFIILPGGIGTLEEFFEILVGRTLGFHSKPIVILNVNQFFEPLLAMVRTGIEQHFIRAKTRDLYHVTDTVASAVALLEHRPATVASPADRSAEE